MRGPETKNRVLAGLPSPARRRLLSKAQFASQKTNEILYGPELGIPLVAFPVEGMISIVIALPDAKRRSVELALVGAEGFIGLPLMYAVESPPTTAIVRAPTYSVVLDAHSFREELEQSRAFGRAIREYAYTFTHSVYITMGCAAAHSIEQRCARWLLMAQDRLQSETLPLTHEALAQSLAVRRASVTITIASLQRAGAIMFQRGAVTITDRKRLEESACGCYRTDPFGAGLCISRLTPPGHEQ